MEMCPGLVHQWWLPNAEGQRLQTAYIFCCNISVVWHARWRSYRAWATDQVRVREREWVSAREREFQGEGLLLQYTNTMAKFRQTLTTLHWFLLQDCQLDESTSKFCSTAFLSLHCVNMFKCQSTNESSKWHQCTIIHYIFSIYIKERTQ